MSFSIFDHNAPHGEASALVAFSQNRLERKSENRDETSLAEAMKASSTRYFAITADRLIMKIGSDRPDGLLLREEIEPLGADFDNAILLGWTSEGAPRIAVSVKTQPDDLPRDARAIDTRSIYRQELMDPEMLGAYAQASSMIAWAKSSRFCGRCGGSMAAEIGGYRRRCTSCDHMVFPRTDPVAIMLAVDEKRDRCLLGRSPHFPEGMYSCLAGFIEPGETIEDAVRRETFEEAGIRIGRVRYHASQPWPMPHTLMIGVLAEATSFQIDRDTAELEDCRWFGRAEAQAMLTRRSGDQGAELTGDQTSAPPPGAIATRLVRDWLDWHG